MYGPVCAQCGQKVAKPFQTKRILLDIWSHFLELDFKFVRASKDIVIKPGKMINDYLAGKRIAYTNPFKFLFFIATAYLLLIQYLEVELGGFEGRAEQAGKMALVFLNYLVYIFLTPTAMFFR